MHLPGKGIERQIPPRNGSPQLLAAVFRMRIRDVPIVYSHPLRADLSGFGARRRNNCPDYP